MTFVHHTCYDAQSNLFISSRKYITSSWISSMWCIASFSLDMACGAVDINFYNVSILLYWTVK